MRSGFLVLGSIFLLGACVQSDNAAIAKACVAQGQAAEDCACVADLAEEKLPADTYAALAEISRSGEEAAEIFVQSMSVEQAVGLATVSLEAAQSCKITGLDWLLP